MVFFFHHNQLFIIKDKMKHILNNLSEEEKNAIREQHAGGMKVITENFSKLVNTKLGDSKPLVSEKTDKTKNSVTEETITEGVKVIVRYSTEFGSDSSIIDVTEIPKFSKRFNILSVKPVEDSYDEEEDNNDRYDSGPK